ncbi:MAG: hypothetical protein J5585_05715 [Clostridia bacterium]|nr:hypothetical protein [Clostridia bacterium]
MKHICYFDVNSHDEDMFGAVRAGAVLRMMQESANIQLYETGFSYDDMYRRGAAFLLSRINVSIYADLHPHDKLRAETWLSDCHGVVFNRFYKLYRGDDLAAEGASAWGLVGVEDKKIRRVSEIDTDIHSDTDTVGIDMPKRLSHKDLEFTLCGERTVYYSDCDINGHMNNTVYPDMLFSFSPEARAKQKSRVVSFNISFITEAVCGEELKVYTAEKDGIRCFRTVRGDGQINAEAEFIIE